MTGRRFGKAKSAGRGNKTVREMDTRIRELDRQLDCKTMEVEILKEALDKSRSEKPTLLAQVLKQDGLP